MKIRSGYLLRSVADTQVVIPIGEAAVDFSGMITLNGSAAFLWQHLANGATTQELLAALLAEYDVDEVTARADLAAFLAKLQAADLLE